MTNPYVFIALSAIVFAACSSTTTSSSDGAVDSGVSTDSTSHDSITTSDSVADASDACVNPTSGESCTTGQVACVPGNLCCDGMWVCANGSWSLERGTCACLIDSGTDTVSDSPANETAGNCGTLNCTAGQYCTQSSGGAYNPEVGYVVTYGCPTFPAACTSTPTCACLQANAAGGSECAADDMGLVTVLNLYP